MRLYGKNPVLERIKASPGSIKKLYLQKRTDLSEIVREAGKAGIDFISVDKEWFKREGAELHAQGVMAEVKEYRHASFGDVLAECLSNVAIPVFLDGVTDPQNLGSVIRNLSCLGGFSLVLPEHNSAQVTETVLRVACGGENYIKIAKVTNNVQAVKKAREEGVWVAGAVAGGKYDILETHLEFPMAAVMGSEGKGIRPGLRKCLDAELALPMRGASLSYNVAVATSLFCYEINRRKWKKK